MLRKLNAARPTVGLSASAVYALLRLDAQGGLPGMKASSLAALRQTLIAGPYPTLGQQLHDLAHSGMPDAILPFRRDELDIAYAAAAIHGPTPCQFFTENAQVDAGYFAVHPQRIEYVDEVPARLQGHPELLQVCAVEGLLEALRLAAGRPPRLSVPPEGDDILHIEGAFTGGRVDGKIELAATLLRLTDDACVSTTMGKLGFVMSSDRFTLEQARPETLMELQAASVTGAWLHLQHPSIELLIPLPDLTEPGATCEGWCYPLLALTQGLGGNPRADVTVGIEVACDALRAAPWAAMHWLDQWAQVAARVHKERQAGMACSAAGG